MLSLYVDLRPKKHISKLCVMPRYRCGCVCMTCHKRMYRYVGVVHLLSQEVPRGVERDELVRGKPSDVRCQCGGDVVFTHCAERS